MKNRITWIGICLLLTTQAVTQNSLPEQSALISSELQHDSLVLVPGTRIRMSRPAGFELASGFPGWQHVAGASIMISSMPAPVSDLISSFTDEKLLDKNIKVEERATHPVHGLEGLWLAGTQVAHGLTYHKVILIFGSEEESHMVVGQSPMGTEIAWDEIQSTFHRVALAEETEIDPLVAAPFEFDWGNSPFQLAQSFGPSLIFSRDGIVPTQCEDEAVFSLNNLFGK